jgi:hypothetical protein
MNRPGGPYFAAEQRQLEVASFQGRSVEKEPVSHRPGPYI